MVKSYLYALSYIIIIFPIITLIISIVYTNTPILTGILAELSTSLNDFPSIDLEFINNCTEDMYPSILYTIPFSKKGCSCTNVKNYHYKQANKYLVFEGKCKKNQTLNGCITIDPYPSVNLKKWHSTEFCSKKFINMTGYKDFFKNSVGKNENCKSGYKKCGKLDNMDNYICILDNETCPINDIIISEKNDLPNYEKYQLNDSLYIYYRNNNSEKSVITKLKTVEEKLCAGKGFYHTKYPQFILDDNFNVYGCKYKIMDSVFDDSISKIDKMTKRELYNYNNISMYSRYNNSCQYPYFSLNAEMFIYPKRYIGFNKTCLIENSYDIDDPIFNQENLANINNNLLRNRKMHEILLWISIAAIDFYFMSCFFINIDESNNLINFYIWGGITLPFYFSMFIISIIGFVSISSVKKYPLCNDYITNNKIELYNKKSMNFFLMTLITFIIINGQLLLTIVLFLLKRKKILLNKNNIIDNSTSISSLSKFNQCIPLMNQSQKENIE